MEMEFESSVQGGVKGESVGWRVRRQIQRRPVYGVLFASSSTAILILGLLYAGSMASPQEEIGSTKAMKQIIMPESVVRGAVRSALVEELAALKAERTRAGGAGYPPTKKLPSNQKLRVLVTGGAGFVGSNLVDKLMSEGHEVIVLDNLFTGRKKNIEHWMGHPSFQFIVGDVVQPIMLEVDQIYHLACPASPPHYQYNPIKTIKTSTEGTLNMLGLAKRINARILLASTSEIYGDPEIHPQVESYWGNVNPIGPRACYDEGKRVAETMMYSYQRQVGVDVRVARIFNTFGRRMHPNDGRVVSNFIIQALQNKDITLYGDGKQTRSFQFVDDLVDGLYKLMNSNFSLPVNLGNPDEYTVASFAHTIKHLTGSNSRIISLPATTDDPRKRKPDISIAKSHIGWSPKWSVQQGLEETIAYFKKELEDMGEIIPTGPLASKPRPVYHSPPRESGGIPAYHRRRGNKAATASSQASS
uniref:UDP-glucuronate decarboxylase n=1 Tax=Aureoumbra lagunensis TaxID=44058 RepID=A0A7S3JT11_9STRA|mmetsp:Transcript_20405/g.26463  ORF Transcript_20405/g.26463 Transcript_20405/m.26463 type:complete len:473 (+) Transcript_20405:154-1572(+)